MGISAPTVYLTLVEPFLVCSAATSSLLLSVLAWVNYPAGSLFSGVETVNVIAIVTSRYPKPALEFVQVRMIALALVAVWEGALFSSHGTVGLAKKTASPLIQVITLPPD